MGNKRIVASVAGVLVASLLCIFTAWLRTEVVPGGAVINSRKTSVEQCLSIFSIVNSVENEQDWEQGWGLVDVRNRGQGQQDPVAQGRGQGQSDACSVSVLSASEAHRCLQRRLTRHRRRALLTIVGDSRSRILQEQLASLLNLTTTKEQDPISPGAIHLSSVGVPDRDEMYQFELNTTDAMCQRNDKFCSRVSGSPLLRVNFWWRPLAASLYRQRLQQVLDTCESWPDHCPDLLLLNSDPWYTRRFWLTTAGGRRPGYWLLMYREHLQALLPILHRLSSLTTVLWRLEEPAVTDAIRPGGKEEYQKRITTANVIAHEVLGKVEGLVFWSSMLPATFDYAENVCRPVRHLQSSANKTVQLALDQCGDELHVGTILRHRFVSMLLRLLCADGAGSEAKLCCRSGQVKPRDTGEAARLSFRLTPFDLSPGQVILM